jgi:uncharacterized protein YjiS (DUF1127 family)
VIVLKLTLREIQSYLRALEECRLQCCKWRSGTKLFERRSTTSILSNITDTTPIAVQRSTRNFARGVFRVINNFVAAIIAERERQANLAILRNLSDRELWDIGLARSQIGAGLAEAAKERAQLQRTLAERSAIKR